MLRISEMMEKKGVTSQTLAEKTGIPKRTIDEYRSARKKEPSFTRGLLIADALGVEPHELLDNEE